MKRTKGFSYDTEKDMDVINHIEKQPHQANYILELIRTDMYEPKNTDIEEIVKKYVEEILKNKDISATKRKEGNISKDAVADLLNTFNT